MVRRPRPYRYDSGRHVSAAQATAKVPTRDPSPTKIGTCVSAISGTDRRTADRRSCVRAAGSEHEAPAHRLPGDTVEAEGSEEHCRPVRVQLEADPAHRRTSDEHRDD